MVNAALATPLLEQVRLLIAGRLYESAVTLVRPPLARRAALPLASRPAPFTLWSMRGPCRGSLHFLLPAAA